MQGGVTRRLSHVAAASEVQALSVCCHGGTESLAVVDSYGRLCVASSPTAFSPSREEPPAAAPPPTVLTAEPPHAAVEPSWAGVAWAESGSDCSAAALPRLAVARNLARCIDVYDGGLHAACIHTAGYPNAVSFLPCSAGGSGGAATHARGCVVATAEASRVVLYDTRSRAVAGRLSPGGGSGGCGGGESLAIAAATGPGTFHLLALACADRTLIIFDIRSGHPLRRLPGLTRKPATHLRFVPSDARYIAVAGSDQQLLLRRWDKCGAGDVSCAESANGVTLRGDARWAGLDVAPAGLHMRPTLAAWSASGVLVAAEMEAAP